MSNLVKKDMFDDMFDYFIEPFSRFKRSGYLKTDVRETKNELVLEVEAPGIKKDEIKVSLKDGYLNISIYKDSNKEYNEKTYIRKERYFENVSRQFYVGSSVKEDDIKCKYTDGILKITLPKSNENYEKECKYLPIN